MRKIISLICLLLPVVALAAEAQIRNDAPDTYAVARGDTLWGIAERFYKNPWKWPDIWGANKDIVDDPHWIYPGDVIRLNRQTNRLEVAPAAAHTEVKLNPRTYSEVSQHMAISSIPYASIAPFLKQPLIVGKEALDNAPTIVGAYDSHVVLGDGDTAYVKGIAEGQALNWQIFRPGKALYDPETKELLGYEATYIGNGQIERFTAPATFAINRVVLEVRMGDRLLPASRSIPDNYIPRAPSGTIDARVISIYGGSGIAGQHEVITLNKGSRDGLENGHVLALFSKSKPVSYRDRAMCEKNDIGCQRGDQTRLPDRRYGLAFVFRTFEKVSYALVMESTQVVEMQDKLGNP